MKSFENTTIASNNPEWLRNQDVCRCFEKEHTQRKAASRNYKDCPDIIGANHKLKAQKIIHLLHLRFIWLNVCVSMYIHIDVWVHTVCACGCQKRIARVLLYHSLCVPLSRVSPLIWDLCFLNWAGSQKASVSLLSLLPFQLCVQDVHPATCIPVPKLWSSWLSSKYS